MKIVLDTNVLVSGLLSPFNAPGEIVRMVSAGILKLCFDARILAEYKDVLRRAKFGLDQDCVIALLEQIKGCGCSVVGEPLKEVLPDSGDEPFLEVAIAGEAICLITGNLKHYPSSCRQGAKVFSPDDFLKFYRTCQ